MEQKNNSDSTKQEEFSNPRRRVFKKKRRDKALTYSDMFLGYNCSGDILNAVSPMGQTTKEISETMAIIKLMKDIALKRKMELCLYDFCAGNALTSVTAVHLLPIKHAYAIDKKRRDRKWSIVQRFSYGFQDIFDFNVSSIEPDGIVVGIHPCRELAIRIIEIFNTSKAKYLFLMPCCHNGMQKKKTLPNAVHEALPKNLRWAYHLSTLVKDSDVNIFKDRRCLSPHQYVIKAVKNDR